MVKVYNRSDGNVVYTLPELNIRRVFNPGETKEIEYSELEALFQTDGGHDLIVGYLLVDDKEWVDKHWDAPIEYFWYPEQVKACVMEDPIDLFEETLDYAPDGVIDLIKMYSWKVPLTDLNKIKLIKDKLGFDVLAAVEFMKSTPAAERRPDPTQRRRREG